MQRSDLERLASSTDDDRNWFWLDEDKERWQKRTDSNQNFYNKWRSQPFKQESEFPYTLALGTDHNNKSLLEFRHGATAHSEIAVTEAYKAMYNRILDLHENPMGNGIVLTGQPGIGKTTFLKYMLVRLISAHQAVILLDRNYSTLFYGGQVYRRYANEAFLDIPEPCGKNEHSLWALIDIDTRNEEPPLDPTTFIWPIQVSSPNPIRWRSWSKLFGAAKWGMPLWTFKELVFGFHLQGNYDIFRKNLETSLDLQSIRFSSKNRAINYALEILKREKEKEKEKKKADFDDMDVDAGASENKGKLDLVDAAIEVLIANAIAEYGLAPRVVYQAIFLPAETLKNCLVAITNLEYEVLEDLVSKFTSKTALESTFSHQLMAVSPIQDAEDDLLDRWTIEFSSIRIAKQVVIAMHKLQEQRLRSMFVAFHKLPESSSLAECVFEAIAHQRLTEGSWPEGEPKGIYMHSDGNETPSFSTAIPLSASSTCLRHSPHLHMTGPMKAESIDLDRSLDGVMVNTNTYYISYAANNPLFDAFTVTIDDSQSIAFISVFQMTISRSYKGSHHGYALIRKLMIRVHELHSDVKIKTVYWLVCPSADKPTEWRWEMPKGWNISAGVNNHRGDVFCLCIPIGVQCNAPP